jgi:SOS response regulatory protein OraA/RecX
MLASKGIPRDIVEHALEDIDDSKARMKLEKLMENKFRSLKDDPQCRLKMLRFGLGRGYAYEEVAEAIDFLMKQ